MGAGLTGVVQTVATALHAAAAPNAKLPVYATAKVVAYPATAGAAAIIAPAVHTDKATTATAATAAKAQ